LRIEVHRITSCGFYRRGSFASCFGGLNSFLDELETWIQTRSNVAATATFTDPENIPERVLSVITAASLAGGWFFADTGIEQQAAAARGLLSAGVALFAILGVWIAVLDPSKMLDKPPGHEPGEREQLARDLLSPWIAATVVFALAFVLNFVLNAIASGMNHPYTKAISGFFLTFLFFLILYVLAGTMLPVARLRYRLREKEKTCSPPRLPYSYGYTIDEAIENIAEAIEVCCEEADEEQTTFIGYFVTFFSLFKGLSYARR
jgi:hypothetical protein